jgi:hypothetical protein
MPLPIASKLVLLSTLTIPAIAVSLRAYLIDHPLPSSRTRTIKTQATLSPSCVPSASLGIVNPKHHQTWTDSFSIKLSRREIGTASDEELLARFTKGFFGGWTFVAENNILMFLHAFGRQLVPVGFSGRSGGVNIDIPPWLLTLHIRRPNSRLYDTITVEAVSDIPSSSTYTTVRRELYGP